MKRIAHYKNGNYFVDLYEDGTKVRYNDLDNFTPEFAESFDCKITNKCPMGCPMCHEKSTPDGLHGDIMNAEFINKLRPGTEMAIGGGAVTGHPDLMPFLRKLKERGVIPSITVHQKEFENNWQLINQLIEEKLVYGIGVSFSCESPMWDMIKDNENIVVHLINGIHGQDVFDYLAQKNMKILILGYKNWGRGESFYKITSGKIKVDVNKFWLFNRLKDYLPKFKVVSFDNLAIEQLKPNRFLTQKQWDNFFQGEDGTHTMYVDLVKKQFAKTSTSEKRYDLLDNIDDMFQIIKNG